MAESYEDLLKQQEIYEKQLEELEYQEYLEKIKNHLENRTKFINKMNKLTVDKIILFIELVYEYINNKSIYNSEELKTNTIPKTSILEKEERNKKKTEIIKVINVPEKIKKKEKIRDTVSEGYIKNVKYNYLTGEEYRSRINEWYDGKQFNILITDGDDAAETLTNRTDGNDNETALSGITEENLVAKWYQLTWTKDTYFDKDILFKYTSLSDQLEEYKLEKLNKIYEKFYNGNNAFNTYKKFLKYYTLSLKVNSKQKLVEKLRNEGFLETNTETINKINFIYCLNVTANIPYHMQAAGSNVDPRKNVEVERTFQMVKQALKVDEIEVIFITLEHNNKKHTKVIQDMAQRWIDQSALKNQKVKVKQNKNKIRRRKVKKVKKTFPEFIVEPKKEIKKLSPSESKIIRGSSIYKETLEVGAVKSPEDYMLMYPETAQKIITEKKEENDKEKIDKVKEIIKKNNLKRKKEKK